MYCSQCGKQIPDNSRFCSFCGARVDNQGMNEKHESAERPQADQQKIEQDVRKGTLVYLHDILSMEFSINKLQRQLNLAWDPVIIHDDWFYWKCYDLSPAIFWYRDCPPYTKFYLCYSYRLNKYYFSFEEGKVTDFYDYNGNRVNHQFGKPGYKLAEMDGKTRDRLCTMPEFKKKLFGGRELINSSSVYFGAHPGIISRNLEKYGNLDCFAQIKPIIEQFEAGVQQREERYKENLPGLKKKIQDIETELENAKKIRDDLYSLNIIPSKYRNLGCAYFIYVSVRDEYW